MQDLLGSGGSVRTVPPTRRDVKRAATSPLARGLEVEDEPAERDLVAVVDRREHAGGQLLAVEEGAVHRADLLGDEELPFLDHQPRVPPRDVAALVFLGEVDLRALAGDGVEAPEERLVREDGEDVAG